MWTRLIVLRWTVAPLPDLWTVERQDSNTGENDTPKYQAKTPLVSGMVELRNGGVTFDCHDDNSNNNITNYDREAAMEPRQSVNNYYTPTLASSD